MILIELTYSLRRTQRRNKKSVFFCPRAQVGWFHCACTDVPASVLNQIFHPWLPGAQSVIWRENKSFHDILSTSQDAESRWAGRRKVLSDLRFDPTRQALLPQLPSSFSLPYSHQNVAQQRNDSKIFLFLAAYEKEIDLIEALLRQHTGYFPQRL